MSKRRWGLTLSIAILFVLAAGMVACGDLDLAGAAGSDYYCGDGHCRGNEDAASCPEDCTPAGPVCGDGICGEGEGTENCAADCSGGTQSQDSTPTVTVTPSPVTDASSAASGGSPEVAMVIYRTFEVYDESGVMLGTGQLRVLAPTTMYIDESSEIRVEIQVDAPVAGAEIAWVPEPTSTPVLGTPQSTPTPLPIVSEEFVEVHEFMGAGLRGIDVSHFDIEAVPPSGLRQIQPQAVNWWKWTIRPVGAEALGDNHLEVFIYLPRARSDGTQFDEETNIIPVTIRVINRPWWVRLSESLSGLLSGAGGSDRRLGSETIIAWATVITACGAAVGVLYKGYQYIRDKPKRDLEGRFELDAPTRLCAVQEAAEVARGGNKNRAIHARQLLEQAREDSSDSVREAAEAFFLLEDIKLLEKKLVDDLPGGLSTVKEVIDLAGHESPAVAGYAAELLDQLADTAPNERVRQKAREFLDRQKQ